MIYDAIVVGARCGGSPTAMLLARRGHRVLLLDRAGFPSDTLSTHYIHQPGVASLARWGLLDRVTATGCPPVRHQRLAAGPLVLRAAPTPARGPDGDIADGYCIRRSLLDHILLEAAVEAGAEARTHVAVEALLRDGDRVTGIRGRAHGGRELVEAARIVVGADGSGSLVARGVGAATYDERPARTCAAYSYWADVPVSDAELYPGIGNALIAAPTNDGLTMVICYWPADAVDATRGDVEAAFVAAAERWAPGLADRLHAGRRVERFRGTGPLPNFFRQAHGDGWALVGDAGYTKDPILALGITDAFRDAELLADAIDDGLSGRRPMAEALAGYQQARDAAARAGYESTMQLAALEPPPPEQQSLMAALVDQPDQAGRFFGTLVGTVAPEDFFAPENIGAIMAGAAS